MNEWKYILINSISLINDNNYKSKIIYKHESNTYKYKNIYI